MLLWNQWNFISTWKTISITAKIYKLSQYCKLTQECLHFFLKGACCHTKLCLESQLFKGTFVANESKVTWYIIADNVSKTVPSYPPTYYVAGGDTAAALIKVAHPSCPCNIRVVPGLQYAVLTVFDSLPFRVGSHFPFSLCPGGSDWGDCNISLSLANLSSFYCTIWSMNQLKTWKAEKAWFKFCLELAVVWDLSHYCRSLVWHLQSKQNVF